GRGAGEVGARMEAVRGGGVPQPLQLARVVLDVDQAALVPALAEPVGERDRMALGTAVDQRTGDENEPHVAFLLDANCRSPGRCAGTCTSAMTAAPTARRIRGPCAASI